ncbi:aldehyde dehydrogenase family protein [Paraburkholderia sp. GV068]|uniref:aldehyde dehydrogenase family protein n=1 Tax=Paraburkholderia TaxID=1822464 RepID=UPI000D41794F|nr:MULTISPECIES: aldehyde dehydrogenase family protein [unclassified Paraburkholderia]PTQ92073.1 aldehyde dehydrogenase family protein [Paraburkholderia sp. GV072]PUA94283.1 aldehyde dehydrogenase family protein [Paraburkholderia sp. GV068]
MQMKGILPALVTPFNPVGAVDHDALANILEFKLKARSMTKERRCGRRTNVDQVSPPCGDATRPGSYERVAWALPAGIVWINHSQLSFIEAPWGGYKQCGIGREPGELAFEQLP